MLHASTEASPRHSHEVEAWSFVHWGLIQWQQLLWPVILEVLIYTGLFKKSQQWYSWLYNMRPWSNRMMVFNTWPWLNRMMVFNCLQNWHKASRKRLMCRFHMGDCSSMRDRPLQKLPCSTVAVWDKGRSRSPSLTDMLICVGTHFKALYCDKSVSESRLMKNRLLGFQASSNCGSCMKFSRSGDNVPKLLLFTAWHCICWNS